MMSNSKRNIAVSVLVIIVICLLCIYYILNAYEKNYVNSNINKGSNKLNKIETLRHVQKLQTKNNHSRSLASREKKENTGARIAIVSIEVNEGHKHSPSIYENTNQYCVRHNYDLVTTEVVYPMFDVDDPWNTATSFFPVSKVVLPLYEWVMYKQFDTIFVNMDISIEDIIKQAPADGHMIIAAHWSYFITDGALLIKNSVKGRDMLDRLISL